MTTASASGRGDEAPIMPPFRSGNLAGVLALRVPPVATAGHFRPIVLRAGHPDGMTEGDAQELRIDLDRLEVKAAEP
jgi:hypothetical protein